MGSKMPFNKITNHDRIHCDLNTIIKCVTTMLLAILQHGPPCCKMANHLL